MQGLTTTQQAKLAKQLCITPYCRRPHGKGMRKCYSCRQKQNQQRNPYTVAYNIFKQNAKRRAKERGVPFEHWFRLDKEQFKQLADEHNYLANKGVRPKKLHIDRKEAHIGYTPDNVRIITCSENCSKAQYERGDVLEDLPF